MKLAISSVIAAVLSACGMASAIYSPMFIWAIVTARYDWYMEMYSPQIKRVPPEIYITCWPTFFALTAILCYFAAKHYPNRKAIPWAGAGLGILFVVVFWFRNGSIFR